MTTLISRLQQATCADRKLFEEAFRVVFPEPERIWITDNTWSPEYEIWIGRSGWFDSLLDAQAWTDAALTLVPQGWAVERLSIWPHESSVSLYGTHEGKDGLRWHNFEDGRVDSITAASPALALCIASLIAHEKGNTNAA